MSAQLLQDPTGQNEGACESSLHRQKIIANFGQSLHLPCTISQKENLVFDNMPV